MTTFKNQRRWATIFVTAGLLAVPGVASAEEPTIDPTDPAPATPAMAGGPPQVFTVISHEDETYLIPAEPECGGPVGSTEVQQGTERLHIVESDDDIHFVAGESVWVYTTWDDPSLTPPAPRHLTDAVVGHNINDGRILIFHESFRDRGTYWGDISVNQTFVQVDGVIKVDHFDGRNTPPEGC